RLGELRAMEASNMLIMSLDDREPAVRTAAAGALGKLGGEGVIEPLIDTLEDLEPAVREAAAHSLQLLTGKDFGYDANEWRRYWKRAH
ncbi:MAG TPA: HEAT repeat domain-containing protein, partial [bacterium]|nr:HEAT repeat domain-containing protein [bacterium]